MKITRILSNILILLWLSNTIGTAGINDGLVAYYPLDGDVLDASGNGYHGVNTGVSFQAGHKGQGAFFDGDSAKHVRIDGFPDIRSNLTIAAWFKPQWLSPGAGALVARGLSSQEAYTLFVGDNFIHGLLNFSIANPADRFDLEVTIPRLSGEVFYHVALVYDFGAGKVSIYLDGQEQGVFDYSLPLIQQTEPLYLGVSFPGGPGAEEVFRGILDDVRIYNRPLNSGEIGELFNGGTRLTIEVSEVRLCWNSLTNKTYQLQYRSDLTTNLWSNLGMPTQGNGTANCATDAVLGRARRFYRIVLLDE